MADPATEQREAVLTFDHDIIEHLGIKLYQNKAINVLAEVVANSWDADASRVWIDTFTGGTEGIPYLAVADNGSGMTYETIRDNYLVIGKRKRQSPNDKSGGGRLPMGRKGIGKLAPFGIARRVDVVSISNRRVNWFTLDLTALMAMGVGRAVYKPDFHIANLELETDFTSTLSHDPTGQVRRFFDRIRESKPDGQSGTLILMSHLTTNEPVTADEAKTGLANRFTVVLLRDDFHVEINDQPIDSATALPEFELRIPEEQQSFNTVIVGGKEVRYWAGFVGSADWASDQAGVGVFVHGKIAQDRPFFFGAKGKEIYQRYLYAVVEADWLDELERDLVSTDRTSIDWDDDAAIPFREWGRRTVGSWLESYVAHRGERHNREVRRAADQKRLTRQMPILSDVEHNAVVELVADATRDLGKAAETATDGLLVAVSEAWMNLPTRQLLKEIWQSLNSTSDTAGHLQEIATKLRQHSVPEAMNLALTFAQRAYALSLLDELIHRRSETKLQTLVEEFPWILEPRGDLLTSDQHLKTTIEKAALSMDGTRYRPGRIVQGMSEDERADFVFLTDASKRTIQIVEIKAPSHELTLEDDSQLSDYLRFTQTFHGSANLSGLLVGNRGNPRFESTDTRTIVKDWNDIFLECRAAYVELLAAMLDRADPNEGDARMQLVHDFGGEAVWELLNRLGEKDERLRSLMERLNSLKTASGDSAS